MTDTYGMSDAEMLERTTVYRDGLFSDNVVLVSGGGSGLGKATAILIARLGAKVIVCGRDEEKLSAISQLFEQHDLPIDTYPMTIRDADAVDEMMGQIWDQHCRLDILVNNAGGQYAQPAVELSVKGWQAVVDTNLNGTWYMSQAAAKRWMAKRLRRTRSV